MSKNRIKVGHHPIITRAEMEQKVARIVKLKVAELWPKCKNFLKAGQ
jgi:hypothetical protein